VTLSTRQLGSTATAPASDLLIAACAFHHGARLEHEDTDFDAIERVADRGANR